MIRVAIIGGKVHSGGKKNLIMEYYRHINRDEVQFDFICDSDSNSVPAQEIESLGGRVFIVPPYQNIVKNMWAIYRILKNNSYDVVHGWNGTMDVFAMIVAKIAGCRVRISESISMGNKSEKKTYIKYALLPFAKMFATHYMANGVDCAKFQFGERAFSNGQVAIFKTVINSKAHDFDKELRETTRTKLGWEGKVVYGFIGRYVPQKNPLFLIEIFREIAKIQPDAHFVTIGFGELEQEMTIRIRDYGLENRYRNLGRREDIKQFYNAFDAFILPSLYEGLPVVGVEAQCAGLPIFMSTEVPKETKACDIAHFLDLKMSPEEWARIIVKATMENVPKRRGFVNEICAAGFDSEEAASRLQKYYTDAIRK